MLVKDMLAEASSKAVTYVSILGRFNAQLETIDNKTKNICSNFIFNGECSSLERIHMAEELLILQQCRQEVITNLMKLNGE